MWLLSSFLLATACSRDTAIRTEIVPIASGQFYAPDWGGTQVERFYAVARPNPPPGADNPNAEAQLVSPENAEPCSLGSDVASYQALKPRAAGKYVLGSPDPTRVLVFRDKYRVEGQDYARLTFSDIMCRSIDLEVPDVWMGGYSYVYSADLSALKYAVTTRDRSFMFVDPWNATQETIARDVYSVSRSDDGFLLTEGSSVVVRDKAGRLLSRRGEEVVSHVLINGQGDYAYLDKRGLFVVRDDKATQVGPADACSALSPTDQFLSDSLAYFRPCDERRLVVARDKVGDKFEYANHVDDWFVAFEGALFFTTTSETATQLWFVSSLDPARSLLIAEREIFGLRSAYSLGAGAIALLLYEVKSNTFSVVVTSLGDPTHTLIPVASGVTGVWPTSSAVALRYANGDVIVYSNDLRRIIMQFPNAGSMPYKLVFQGKAAGLAYLSDFDASTGLGRLELELINGDHFVLADQVRDFGEVWWPERGLLFTTGGARPALSFARVDIPCETTSETAWACGF